MSFQWLSIIAWFNEYCSWSLLVSTEWRHTSLWKSQHSWLTKTETVMSIGHHDHVIWHRWVFCVMLKTRSIKISNISDQIILVISKIDLQSYQNVIENFKKRVEGCEATWGGVNVRADTSSTNEGILKMNANDVFYLFLKQNAQFETPFTNDIYNNIRVFNKCFEIHEQVHFLLNYATYVELCWRLPCSTRGDCIWTLWNDNFFLLKNMGPTNTSTQIWITWAMKQSVDIKVAQIAANSNLGKRFLDRESQEITHRSISPGPA